MTEMKRLLIPFLAHALCPPAHALPSVVIASCYEAIPAPPPPAKRSGSPVSTPLNCGANGLIPSQLKLHAITSDPLSSVAPLASAASPLIAMAEQWRNYPSMVPTSSSS